MSEGNIVYNLLRSSDILWADDITGTAQRITLSHVWVRKLISSEAFARIFKPGHTYTLSYSGKVIEPAPDTADTVYRDDRFGVALYTSAGGWSKSFDAQEYLDNPPAGYTFHKSMTFTTPDTYPGDVRLLVYSDYSRDKSGAEHQGIVEIDDLMIVEGSTPAAWAPAEGETVYNLLRSDDILWAGDITGTAQRITLSHIWARQLISSEAFARIFKPDHTYTLSYSGKVIEPAPDTAYREDGFGITLYSGADSGHLSADIRVGYSNPPAGYTFHMSSTFTTPDAYPGDVQMLAYSGYSSDESGAVHLGIVEIDDLMIVEGSTPAAWAPAEGETLTADVGGGMSEPTNLVKTQPDATPATNNTRIWSRLNGTAQDSTTDYHIAATINPDAQIAAGAIGLSIKYTDSSGAENWPRSAIIASAIPANAWTRIESTVTLPAGMTPYAVSIWWPSMHFRACNLVVYPLTGGRIVRARGAAALVSVNDGAKGDTGKGATSIIEQYYLSTSSTTQAGGSWSTTQPTWSSGKYIWTRSHITWTDGTTTDTTPVLAGGLNSANQNAFNANNTANNANNTANSAKILANSAQSTADGKNKVIYSTSDPSSTSGYKAGDTWFNRSTGGIWQFNGSAWAVHQVGTVSIQNGAITADKIVSSAVTADKIVSSAVTADKIASSAVTADKIASRTITANNIKAGVITATEIAAGTITGDKLAARTITADRLKAGAITSNEIAAGTITADKIASRTLTADKIKAGAITSNEIAAGTITANNIASRAITADRIKAGALTATEMAAGTITADKVNMDSLQTNIGYIGNKSGRHVEITSDAVKLMLDGSTILGSFGSGGISLGNVFSVDPSGNGAYSGKITAKSGTIGGWTIDSVSLSRSTVSGSRTTKSLLADGKYAIYGNETSDGVVYNIDHKYDFVGLNYTRSWKIDDFDLDYKTSAIIGYNDSTYSDYIFHMYNTGTTEEILMQHGDIRMTGDLRVGADVTWAPGSQPAHLGGNVRANTFNSIELKNLIKTKYLTASNKKFVKNGSSNNTISVPAMSGYNIMGVYAATIDSDKVYPYNSYYDADNKVFHVLGHNISGADVTTAIHGIAFYIANV